MCPLGVQEVTGERQFHRHGGWNPLRQPEQAADDRFGGRGLRDAGETPPGTVGRSPRRKAFRSMPALNVPPTPVMTAVTGWPAVADPRYLLDPG
jgi:hypothetical protein